MHCSTPFSPHQSCQIFKATFRYSERFAKYFDQIGSSKNHTFKGRLQLTQPVAEVPVVKLEHEEEIKPRFDKKEGFKRNPLLWFHQPPIESTIGKIRKAWSQYIGWNPPC